jgi:chaperonin GroES
MTLRICPVGDRILVRPDVPLDKTPGGIILPDQAKTPPRRGVVLAVGPGRLRDDGETRVPMELQGGERILFDRWAGTDIDVGGEELKIMREADVMALDEG